jgi:hypothetical protein
MFHQAIQSLNGGEITPYLAHTTGLDKHSSSLARMENFLPMPFGGMRKRPGTLHLGPLPQSASLAPFIFSDSARFLFAISSDALLIYDPDGVLVETITEVERHPDGEELSVSFPAPELVQYLQLNDVVFLVHPHGMPLRLSRMADDSWLLEEVPYYTPPMRDENLDERIKITTDFPLNTGAPAWATATNYAAGSRVSHAGVSWACNAEHISAAAGQYGPPGTASYYVERVIVNRGRSYSIEFYNRPLWTQVFIDAVSMVGGEVTLASSVGLFTEDHVGAYWRISRKRSKKEASVRLAANNSDLTGTVKYSEWIAIQGGWTFNTFGTWYGTFSVEISRDRGQTVEELRSYFADGDDNIATDGSERDRVLMRIKWDHVSNGSSSPRAVLASTSAFITGYVRITEVTDPSTAKSICLSPVEYTTTEFWAEGAFSAAQGYPISIGIHDQRLIFAGTKACPLGMWLSRADDLLQMAVDPETATDEDSAIFRQLASRTQDPIAWIESQKQLLAGTAAEEWVIGSESSDKPISPVNFVARAHTNYGSAPMAGIRIGPEVFFLERQRRRIRGFAYVFEQEGYDAADLTRLAEHITETGIVSWAYQANREPMLWAVRADGVLLSFAYNRPERIFAWARHTFHGGLVRSVAVLRDTDGDDDVYLVVQRGAGFHLERFASGMQLAQETDAIGDFHFVDSGVILATTGGDHRVQMPDHFAEGDAVVSLADGIYREHAVDASRRIYLPVASSRVHAGYAIRSVATTLPQDIQMDNGVSHSRNKKAKELRFNLYKSRGGGFSVRSEDEESITFSTTGEPTDSAPLMFTGWMRKTAPPGDGMDLFFSILQREPYPFTLRCVVFSWEVTER